MKTFTAILISMLYLFSFSVMVAAGDNPPGWDKGEKKGWQGESEPRGWDQGEKEGWDGEDHPPGHEDKDWDDRGNRGEGDSDRGNSGDSHGHGHGH